MAVVAQNTSGSGGSSVVIVRYEGERPPGTGGTVTAGTGSAAGYTLHTFTTVGARGPQSDLARSRRTPGRDAHHRHHRHRRSGLQRPGPAHALRQQHLRRRDERQRRHTGPVAHASNNNLADSPTIHVAGSATLSVTGLDGGNLVLSPGQTLSGSGTIVGDVTIGGGAVISPGDSPGTTPTGSQTWNPAGNYTFEINDAAWAMKVPIRAGTCWISAER